MYLMCAGLGLLGLYVTRSVFNASFLTLMIIALMTKVGALPLVNSMSTAQWMIDYLVGRRCGFKKYLERRNAPNPVVVNAVS